jgi:uncharacterized protein (DUF58 family)
MNFRELIYRYNNTSFYLSRKVYYAGYLAAALFVLSYFWPALFSIGLAVLGLAGVGVLIDTFLLYSRKAIRGERFTEPRWSLGDENKVVIQLHNGHHFAIQAFVIDELPYQFQARDWLRKLRIEADSTAEIVYMPRPLERGEYHYGFINVYVHSPLDLVRRRYRLRTEQMVKVYPSFIQMRRYELLGVGSRSEQMGVKRMRKLGHSMEFEQIKDYVPGDDYRTINWKATARRGGLMVNNYTDERSQQIYCLINKGRVMKMPFEGLTLLDYSINAALVLLNTALQKHDKAGLITFAENLDYFLPADKKPGQLNHILDTLYRQETNFLEPDFEKLFSVVRNRITQRSLLVLFTNFESVESLERELPSLKRLAHYHLLVVVLFENTELKQLLESKVKNTEDIYLKTIADKYRHEKLLIARELQKNGIVSILSTPQRLTVNALNKYLELKNRQSI